MGSRRAPGVKAGLSGKENVVLIGMPGAGKSTVGVVLAKNLGRRFLDSDLVIQEYELDDIIRKAVRKYAGQFIRRKIRLVYAGTDERVVTDEKWLSFIIEQLLSNAVKYTPEGGNVTISVDDKKQLSVTDTGIGISPEDLPRIFEKGYTGYNGRLDKKSTGIGLYLCRTAADKLGHRLLAQSEPGKGSRFIVDLKTYSLQAE